MQMEMRQLRGIARITPGRSLVTLRTCTFLKMLICCLKFWLSFRQDKTASIVVARNATSQFTHPRLSSAAIPQPPPDKRSELASDRRCTRHEFSTAIPSFCRERPPLAFNLSHIALVMVVSSANSHGWKVWYSPKLPNKVLNPSRKQKKPQQHTGAWKTQTRTVDLKPSTQSSDFIFALYSPTPHFPSA